MGRSSLLLAAAFAAITTTASAQGQPSLQEAARMLEANDLDQVRTGIESIGLLGDARAVGPLSERIRRGLPPALLDVALDTLAVLARPEAGPVLFELVMHRRADVRLKAVQAIVASRPRGADRALATALADGDARVRAAAALGLGTLGARDTMDTLFLALERGVLESATALGQIVPNDGVPRLLGYLGRVPFDSMAPGLNEILARREIPEATKLEVIARLQELATPEAKAFLQAFVASLAPPAEPPRGRRPPRPDRTTENLRRAAEDAILRIAD